MSRELLLRNFECNYNWMSEINSSIFQPNALTNDKKIHFHFSFVRIIYWDGSASRHKLTLIDKLRTTEMNDSEFRSRAPKRCPALSQWQWTSEQSPSDGSQWCVETAERNLATGNAKAPICLSVFVSLSQIIMACNIMEYLTGNIMAIA